MKITKLVAMVATVGTVISGTTTVAAAPALDEGRTDIRVEQSKEHVDAKTLPFDELVKDSVESKQVPFELKSKVDAQLLEKINEKRISVFKNKRMNALKKMVNAVEPKEKTVIVGFVFGGKHKEPVAGQNIVAKFAGEKYETITGKDGMYEIIVEPTSGEAEIYVTDENGDVITANMVDVEAGHVAKLNLDLNQMVK